MRTCGLKPLLGSGAGWRLIGTRKFHCGFESKPERGGGKLESLGWVCFEGISAGFGCGLRISSEKNVETPKHELWEGFLTHFPNRFFFASLIDDREENYAEVVPSFAA